MERWVIVSKSQYDQPPLSQDAEAGVETRAGATGSDNPPQFPSTSKVLLFFQTQSHTQQPESSFAAPTQFFC